MKRNALVRVFSFSEATTGSVYNVYEVRLKCKLISNYKFVWIKFILIDNLLVYVCICAFKHYDFALPPGI